MKTKGEKTKLHIIDVAAELFWKNSYQGVNTSTISSNAGVNKATMYRYFPSKRELALSVVERYLEQTLTEVFELSFQSTNDPIERLEKIYHLLYQMHQHLCETEGKSPGCPFINIALEMAAAEPEVRIAVDQCLNRLRQYYQQIVRDAKQLNISLNALDEAQSAQSLVNIMNGAMVASKIKNRPEEILEMLPVAKSILQA